MSEAKSVSLVEITVIGHATESRDALLKVLESVLPGELVGTVKVSEKTLHGHYGNPIRILRVVVEQPHARNVFEYILRRMDPSSRRLLKATINLRLQGGRILHLRLHKQYLLDNKLVLWDGDDTVKVTVRFRSRREAAKILERIGED